MHSSLQPKIGASFLSWSSLKTRVIAQTQQRISKTEPKWTQIKIAAIPHREPNEIWQHFIKPELTACRLPLGNAIANSINRNVQRAAGQRGRQSEREKEHSGAGQGRNEDQADATKQYNALKTSNESYSWASPTVWYPLRLRLRILSIFEGMACKI